MKDGFNLNNNIFLRGVKVTMNTVNQFDLSRVWIRLDSKNLNFYNNDKKIYLTCFTHELDRFDLNRVDKFNSLRLKK